MNTLCGFPRPPPISITVEAAEKRDSTRPGVGDVAGTIESEPPRVGFAKALGALGELYAAAKEAGSMSLAARVEEATRVLLGLEKEAPRGRTEADDNG